MNGPAPLHAPLMDLDEIARGAGGEASGARVAVSGVTTDSRAVLAGDLFVALVGERFDGHDYVAQALERGAAAALVSRAVAVGVPQVLVADTRLALGRLAAHWRARFSLPVAALTGSNGKTTVKDMVAAILATHCGGGETVLATEGNLNNFLGVPLTLVRLESGVTRHAVVEAGINMPGEMRGLATMIQPDHALVTLVAPAHLERLGSVETVAHEKSELLRWLPAGGLAVVPWAAWEYPCFRHCGAAACVAVPAGIEPAPSAERTRFVVFTVQHAAAHTEVALHAGGPARRFRLRRVSDGMAQNAVLALLLASALGVSDEQMQRRLEGWEPARLRGELRECDGRPLYLDCYNANPASMADALAVFQQLAPANLPRLYLLGGMEELGAAAADYHRRLGAGLRLRECDRVAVLGPFAAAVEEGLLAAGNARSQVTVAASLEEVRGPLAEFRGAVFVKGSRRFQLESLFSVPSVPAASH